MACVAGAVCTAETPQWPKNPPKEWMTYHLAHPGPGRAWPGDPNPAFYYKGRYHLHYIYKQPGKQPQKLRGYAYAHVSSKDMVHWKWHPTVLTPKTFGYDMFSGTGFFTKEGEPAMIFHGDESGWNWVSYALDDNLDKWSKPDPTKAKTKDGKLAKVKYWDPDCWLYNDTYYALSGGKDPDLMKSKDLKNWEYLGKVLHDDYPSNLGVTRKEDVSCANMFKIGNKWMMLCISHRLGCRYFLGDFKDEKYLPDFHAMMNWQERRGGACFFAPESLLTKDGRRVMWAWIMRAGAPSGVQSLPRELELPKDGVLRIRPLRELEALRYDKKQQKKITVKKDDTYVLKQIAGDALELKVEFKSSPAKEYGIDVLCGASSESALRISVAPESKTLSAEIIDAPLELKKIEGIIKAPFELKKSEDVTLRVFIDKNLVEVFANDRQAVVAYHRGQLPTKFRLFSIGSDSQVNKVTAWKMKSIYQGNTVFKGN